MSDVDVVYRPNLSDASWAAPYRPSTALIVGRPTEDLLKMLRPLGVEVRATDSQLASLLNRGMYAIQLASGWALIVVPTGRDAEPDEAAERDAVGHLGNAPDVYGWWDKATSVADRCIFRVGDLVRPHGESRAGVVVKTLLQGAGYDVHVRVDGSTRTFGHEDLVLVEGDPEDPAFWVTDLPGRAADMALTLSYMKLQHPLSDILYSYGSSKTLFRPYQFVPVLKLLNSPSGRLLVADEVGLGKTIEAGLIWSELEQRERLHRVLILAPAALVDKWKAEMRRRFDRPVEVMTTARLREFVEEVRQGRDEELHAVMSLQALRGATDLLQALQEINPRFDLVIVDEAHAMRNRGTSTHELGQLLSDWSDTLVFLSATPLNLGRRDLFNLVNILDAEQFDDEAVFQLQLEPNRVLNSVARGLAAGDCENPRQLLTRLDEIHGMALGGSVTERPDFATLRQILDSTTPLSVEDRARAKRILSELNTLSSVFTRTRKVDVPDAKAEREAVQINVDWSQEERAFYENVKRLYIARAAARNVPVGFALQMPLRQAASCIPAMQEVLQHSDFEEMKIQLFEDEDDGDYGFTHGELTAEEFRALTGLDQPIVQDSKLEALRDRLILARRNGMRQAMIFSFFKGTLKYLARKLHADFSLRVLTGDSNMIDRAVIMDDFRAGKFELLLLSQVGSEGLDFEFCNVLVNYDLPWNPMQVEQRIGRLDRFGQEHEKIFIFNMHIPGTIETDIFERLYHRIGVFKESIGDLEPILRDELDRWTHELMHPRLTDDQRLQQADRIAVAIEAKKLQIEQLGESTALLSTPDVLQIDGMTHDGPTDGRYVGVSEVRRMLDVLFRRFGGSLTEGPSDGRSVLTGTPALATALSRASVARQGSMYSIQHLTQQLMDGDEIPVTFNAAVASRHHIELLSSRHPLIGLAVKELSVDQTVLRRFGYVGIPGLPPGQKYAVRIDLVQTTGIRPRIEFWASAVELGSGNPAHDVEGPLLTALAEGSFVDIDLLPIDVPLDLLESLLSAKRRRVRDQRRRDNEAMVEGRIQSRRQGIERKIRRAEATLEELESKGSDYRIRRLHEGRIRNLRTDVGEVVRRLEARKALTMSSAPVAVLIVQGI